MSYIPDPRIAIEVARVHLKLSRVREENPLISTVGRAVGGIVGGAARAAPRAAAAARLVRGRAAGRRKARRKKKAVYRGARGVRFSNAEMKQMLQLYTMIGLMGAIRHA